MPSLPLARVGERRSRPLHVLRVPAGDLVRGLAFAHAGSRLVALTGGLADHGPDSDRKLLVWGGETLEKLVERPVPETMHVASLADYDALLLANASGTMRRVRLGTRARTVGFVRRKGPKLRRVVVDRAASHAFIGDENTRIDRVSLSDGATRRVSDGAGRVISMDLSPDGGRLAVLTETGLHLLDAMDGTPLRSIRISLDDEARVVWVDDRRVAFCCSESRVHVVEVHGGDGPTFRGHWDTVRALAPLGAGLVASGGDDGTVAVWRADDGALVGRLGAHGHLVSSLAFDPQTGRLASASDDGIIAVWDATRAAEAGDRGHLGDVRGLVWRAGEREIVTAGRDGDVRVWDVDRAACVHRVALGAAIGRVHLSADGRRLVVRDENQGARVLDAHTFAELSRTKLDEDPSDVFDVAADASVAVSSPLDTALRVHDLSGRAPARDLALGEHRVRCAAISADGARVLVGTISGCVVDVDVLTGEVLVLGRARGSTRAIARIGHGARAVALWSDGTLPSWTVSAHGYERLEVTPCGLAQFVASDDGARLVARGKDDRVSLWDPKTGSFLGDLPSGGHVFTTFAFDASGTWLVGLSREGACHLWEVRTRRLAGTWETDGHVQLTSCAVRADGTCVVVDASGDLAVLRPRSAASA